MKKAVIIIITILIVTFSCKENPQTEKTTPEEVGGFSMVDNLPLKLNDGTKWMANLETQRGVDRMDSIITVFNASRNKDYESLGKSLSQQTAYIIKNCTMEGESHDQLHIVLVPMLDVISILKESSEPDTSRQALNQLEGLISGYFNHFRI